MTAADAEKAEAARYLRDLADKIERGDVVSFANLCWTRGAIAGDLQMSAKLDRIMLAIKLDDSGCDLP